MRRLISLAALALALAGCPNTPISQNPVADVTSGLPPVGGISITQGLQEAAYNLDNAVAVGALTKADPAPACVHGVLVTIGADVVVTPTGYTPVAPAGNVASFTPKESDLISIGSVAYIRIQQAKQLVNGGLQAPTSCEALLGQILIDGATQGLKHFLP